MTNDRIGTIIASLTLEEKASLASGKSFWETQDIPAKGVPSIWLADGPHGLRKEDRLHIRENGGHSVKATCFPTASALACAWSPALARRVGAAIGRECRAHGVAVVLGPGVNIKRSPLCGRNFEYYSEDPLLAGKLAAGFIRGAEGEGVGTSLKHFAVNNQETLRMSVSAEVDERALHELYLRPFEIAVKEGAPSTVMCSYNRINGVYASENRMLLTRILREQWGFDGLVMSDWGAVYRRPAGVAAGLDLEMPSSGGVTDREIVRAVRAGRLDEAALDALCARVLRLALAHAPQRKKAYPAPVHHVAAVRRMLDRHHALAVRAARESAVLLKNEGRVLPLAPDAKVAVVGALAGRRCRYQGAGSSLINAHGRPDFLHALVRGGCRDAAYAPGYDPDSECVDAKLEEKALNAARGADTVLLFLGLTDLFETEGYDRAHMRLPFNQLHLLDRLAGAGKDVVVVLAGGSPVETPWLPRAKAVLYTALGGEGVGEAVFQLLYGRACPAGRLAETWPKRLEDTPAARHWPMGPDAVTYNESIYVGYRYYDKAHVDVRFPFGYGLSYTSFAYSGLTLSRKVLAPGKAIEVLFTVENTGAMAGVETAQVYVAHRNSAAHQPVRTLAGFARVALKPGERKTVCVTLPPSALEFYAVARHAFVVEAGRYEVSVGRHSRCLLLHAAFTARGETVALPPAHSAGGPYGSFADNTFPDAAFAAIHTRPLPRNQKPVRGEYTQTTVLGDMLDSRTGRALHALALCAARLGMHFSNNPAVNRRVCEMTVRDLPFKNLVLNTSGIIHYPAAEALLALANGRLFSRGGTVRAERGRSRKG